MAAKKSTPPQEAAPTTVWIRNDSTRGALEVPLLGREVGRGEVVEVSAAQAEILTRQAIWTVTDAPTPSNSSDGE